MTAARRARPPAGRLTVGRWLRAAMESEALEPAALARRMQVPLSQLGALLADRAEITADLAQRLARAFPGTDAAHWLDLQRRFPWPPPEGAPEKPASAGAALRRAMRAGGFTQAGLTKALGVPRRQVAALCADRAPLTDDLVVRLAQTFGTTKVFWRALQQERPPILGNIRRMRTCRAPPAEAQNRSVG